MQECQNSFGLMQAGVSGLWNVLAGGDLGNGGKDDRDLLMIETIVESDDLGSRAE